MPDEPGRPPAGGGDFEREALVHLDAVYRFARTMTGSDADAEDLSQETYLQAWRHWQQYTAGTNCRAWLFTICRNLRIKTVRRREREIVADDAEMENLAAAALHAGLVDSDPMGQFLDAPELAEVVRREVQRLPLEYREAVALADLEDQSYESIAQVLGVPIGTVKSRLFRGRRMLQQSLINYAHDAGLVARPGAAPQ